MPSDSIIEMIVNSSQTFQIDVSDIDSNDLTIEWSLDDNLVLSNTSGIVYTPTDEDIGIHSLSVNVTDNNPASGTLSYSWLLSVLTIDNDGDGWRSNVDCNDNISSVNPGVQ